MKKVYIAGKITGDPDYRAKFHHVEKQLTKKGYIVMNPAILPEGFEWAQYMKITLAMMEACDTIFLMKGWEESRGAKIELNLAMVNKYNILIQKGAKPPNVQLKSTK